MSDRYMDWFHMPDVLIVYPVYLMTPSTQKVSCVGYRATINRPFKRLRPLINFEMSGRDHTLAEACSFVNAKRLEYPELQTLRVMHVDQHDPSAACEIDLTNEETTLLSILKIG